jgi:uncharacterized protein (TIGR02246 family)
VRKAALVVAALLIATSAFAQAKPSAAPVSGTPEVAAATKAIEAANARFVAALKKGDGAAAAANYTDDAIVMMPGEPAWKGRAAILKGLQDFVGMFKVTAAEMRSSQVMVGGDLAVETGTMEWTLQPKSGAAIKDKGKYLTVWKKQADGGWKIVRDINNTDLPPSK